MARAAFSGFEVRVQIPKGIKALGESAALAAAKTQLQADNRDLARLLQFQVGNFMEGSYKRPTVSTGRLLRVTMDPKNRKSGLYDAAVGDPAFLNRSIAKYWRTIEEGSAATWTKRSFLSLPLQGFWGHTLGSWKSGPSGPWVSVSKPYDRTPKGMYQPFRTGRGGKASPLPIFTPGHEIAPNYAYRRAAENPELDRHNLANAVEFWDRILKAGIRP